ncbi:MAG: hypothetical protein ABSA41_10220 [Terriglobia bacterium]|jgi:hypothetical protein
MPETKIISFGLNEIVQTLIKQLDIHDGLWSIYIEFGFGVANIPVTPDSKVFQPAVINVVNKIGIQKQDSPTNLTVDAAKVNPPATVATSQEALPAKEP